MTSERILRAMKRTPKQPPGLQVVRHGEWVTDGRWALRSEYVPDADRLSISVTPRPASDFEGILPEKWQLAGPPDSYAVIHEGVAFLWTHEPQGSWPGPVALWAGHYNWIVKRLGFRLGHNMGNADGPLAIVNDKGEAVGAVMRCVVRADGVPMEAVA